MANKISCIYGHCGGSGSVKCSDDIDRPCKFCNQGLVTIEKYEDETED